MSAATKFMSPFKISSARFGSSDMRLAINTVAVTQELPICIMRVFNRQEHKPSVDDLSLNFVKFIINLGNNSYW